MYEQYESEVEEICDVCGGCDRVGGCAQGQEVMACNHEVFETRRIS
jgi:hypothetical protein